MSIYNKIMRYLIAIPLPESIDASVRSWYQATFNSPCPVRFLHCTLIPPFSTTNPDEIDSILKSKINNLKSVNCSFGPPALFTQKSRQILYLPLLPAAPLTDLHTQLINRLTDYLVYDMSPYSSGTLPTFTPHVTLNYNFKGLPPNHSSFIIYHSSFNLPTPNLYQEQGQGLWVPLL